ncbi:FAD-binding oxidoreductase [Synechococcus sp. Cruz-9H2]|uniref:FAD-binding oxidoreductase n=1 Tax=unclassified Synechococcus TaxID=2626047 RepID=UPI0020CF6ECD|nr:MULTISPECIES: FAD-binding oxidoreductase [unclassified Synechococcus]MCP9819260.1 FAD-binding oxidoreductase [Synechococcus sp. Cruz-9H2]MCP9843054.1 FAD-binding oxidoreductase [Synechococcus sp. Edmonson 11F2]MCP9854798.1 FAD-binding oxidoreductase [Synechococcus sp. Cruz-9C9]MCP9862731.1 FAD-binding oxidoreductase [Synechococcus sp. Cruz-7E5]MCP9870170.1 FAD-binding oxidoreductase [Synechococcus sp. Cruz-7B9]
MITPEPHDLADFVRALHADGTPWLPAGSGSRLHWGPPVQETSTVVSSQRLNRILDHAVGDFTVTVEAGTPLRELQEALRRENQWLTIDWPWGSDADGNGAGTVGGLVARGLAGGLRQRYLGVRDQLIGIGLLRADGVAAHAGGKVVKNVAGYDLMRLFTGSWGSLGLITELTLRTSPQPPERRGLLLQGELEPLDELRRWLQRSSLTPELIDWWSPTLAAQAGADPQHALLLGLASVSDAALRAQCLEIRTRAELLGLRGQPLDPERLEALRAVALGRPQPDGWLLRLGTLPAQTSALLAERVLRDLPLVLGAGSGLGYSWAGSDLPAYRVEELRRSCVARGGVLTVLQQPPGTSPLPAWEDVPSKPMIEAVKAQFDPKQQLARGRLPGVHNPLES